MSDSAELLASRCKPKALSLNLMARTLKIKLCRAERRHHHSIERNIYRQIQRRWRAPAKYANPVTLVDGRRRITCSVAPARAAAGPRSMRALSPQRAWAGRTGSLAFHRRRVRAENRAALVF